MVREDWKELIDKGIEENETNRELQLLIRRDALHNRPTGVELHACPSQGCRKTCVSAGGLKRHMDQNHPVAGVARPPS